ncbi:MAG: tripartite tricarboxylate transporter substrate binding protein [Betaproteobacteria bacterium]|nr:tripartite tricarboxylate transporter substrate binding protein [Betaproteobacteria bacterium]
MIAGRRNIVSRIGITVASAALALIAATVTAQSYPSKTVEFVAHVNPGGGTDVFARLIMEIIGREKLISQPMIVSNRAGGAGTVAFNYIKSKRGEPHTVLTIATGSFVTAISRTDLDLGLEHFTPLAFFARDPQGVIVPTDSKYKTFKDLVDDAKAQSEAIVCAVTSATGTGRQTLWRIERATGAKFKFVTFKAGSEAVLSVLGGHVPFTTENVSEAWAHIEAKKMRVLAVTTEKRMPALPDVPTLTELGYKVQIGTGRGFGMPAGVPKEAVAAMEAILEKVHKSALWRDYSQKNMYEDRWMGSAAFAGYLAEQRAAQKEFIDSIGLSRKP